MKRSPCQYSVIDQLEMSLLCNCLRWGVQAPGSLFSVHCSYLIVKADCAISHCHPHSLASRRGVLPLPSRGITASCTQPSCLNPGGLNLVTQLHQVAEWGVENAALILGGPVC